MLLAVLATVSCGGDDSADPASAPVGPATVASGVETTSTTTSSTAPTPSTTPTSTTAPTSTTSTSTTTTTAVPKPPVEDIVVAGDSMALGLYPPLQAALQTPDRPVGFSWALVVLDDERRVWERLFTIDRPDVVIVHFSVWENAVLRGNEVIDSGDEGWPEIYRRDYVDPWIERAVGSGSHVVWIGLPPAANTSRWTDNHEINAVWRTAVLDAARQQRQRGEEPSIEWVDIDQLLTAPDGRFTEIDRTVDPPERLFNVDGLHWCPAGAARVAQAVVEVLAADVDLGGDDPPPVPDWRTAPWANEPVVVPSAQGSPTGLSVAYPEGECPPVAE